MDAINTVFQMALKDDELNNIALKKDKKYGYNKRIIEENIIEDNKTGDFNEIINTLPDIENICSESRHKKKEGQ